VAITIVAIFLSGLHLTNSHVMSQVRASLESNSAMRVLGARAEQVRSAPWTQVTDPTYLQSAEFFTVPQNNGELGSLTETIQLTAHLAAPGSVAPITVSRSPGGAVTVIDAGDGTMGSQSSARVDLTAAWTGKGGRPHTRQVTLVIGQGGLLGRN
jgi:hypothetical protein